jgi:hypothetical protein
MHSLIVSIWEECSEGKSGDIFKIIKFVIITYLPLSKIDLYASTTWWYKRAHKTDYANHIMTARIQEKI